MYQMGVFSAFPGQIKSATTGSYNISALTMDPSVADHPQIYRMPKTNTNQYYYISMRAPFGFDKNLASTYVKGLSIHKSTSTGFGRSSLVKTLGPGETFTDSANRITITAGHKSTDLTNMSFTVNGSGSGSGSGSVATEIIIDNTSTNTSRTGTWKTSSTTGYYATGSLYSDSGSTFRWIPNLSAGRYKVYARWTYSSLRSSSVPYRTTHKAGTSVKYVNQKDSSLGSVWVLMGEYEFNSGTGGYITVSSENGQASADAVKFVRVP
jgi:hypothetical protein